MSVKPKKGPLYGPFSIILITKSIYMVEVMLIFVAVP